jgi:hypothetical protein
MDGRSCRPARLRSATTPTSPLDSATLRPTDAGLYGPLAALDNRARPGKEPTITPEAEAWLVPLACDKAKGDPETRINGHVGRRGHDGLAQTNSPKRRRRSNVTGAATPSATGTGLTVADTAKLARAIYADIRGGMKHRQALRPYICPFHVKQGGMLLYKDMGRRPLWRAWANRLHDLLMVKEWIHYARLEDVVHWARAAGLALERQGSMDVVPARMGRVSPARRCAKAGLTVTPAP